jgi:FtsH-binding integral membrane protein
VPFSAAPGATDAVSLAFGSVFLVVVAFWLLVRSIHIDLPAAGWFLAGGLIMLGLTGLVVAVRPRRT